MTCSCLFLQVQVMSSTKSASSGSFALDRYNQEMGLINTEAAVTMPQRSLLVGTQKQRQEINRLLRQLEVLLPMGEGRLRFAHLKVIELREAEASGVLDGGVHAVSYVYKGKEKYRLYSSGETLDRGKQEVKRFLPYYTGEQGIRADGSTYRMRNRDAVWLGIELPLLQEINQSIQQETEERMRGLYLQMEPSAQTQRTEEERFLIEAYYAYCDSRSQSQSPEENRALMVEFFAQVEGLRKGRSARPQRLTQAELIRLIKREIYNYCGKLARYYSQQDSVWVNVGGKSQIALRIKQQDAVTRRWSNRTPAELVTEMHRCLLELAHDKIGKDRVRLDEEATFYAPVSFAENEQARQGSFEEGEAGDEQTGWIAGLQQEMGEGDEDESRVPKYGTTSVDIVKALPWVILDLVTKDNASMWETSLRFRKAKEAVQALENTLSTAKKQLTSDAFKAAQARFAIVHDPNSEVGAVGSTGILRTLSEAMKQQIRERRFEVEGDRVLVHVPGVSRSPLKLEESAPKAGSVVQPIVGSLSEVGL